MIVMRLIAIIFGAIICFYYEFNLKPIHLLKFSYIQWKSVIVVYILCVSGCVSACLWWCVSVSGLKEWDLIVVCSFRGEEEEDEEDVVVLLADTMIPEAETKAVT